jgi:hypothetical protein
MTITLFSSDDRPEGLNLPAGHADQIRNGVGFLRLQFGGVRVSSACAPGRRTRRLSPPVAMA